jgi:hypothetical protein
MARTGLVGFHLRLGDDGQVLAGGDRLEVGGRFHLVGIESAQISHWSWLLRYGCWKGQS